jgi:hypothetical protein
MRSGRADCVAVVCWTVKFYPQRSGGLSAYEFHIEVALQWTCDDCGAYLECLQDIREDEADAPYGKWAKRKGEEGMAAGWYVPPLTDDGSLTCGCLCRDCAKRRGLEVIKADVASS